MIDILRDDKIDWGSVGKVIKQCLFRDKVQVEIYVR